MDKQDINCEEKRFWASVLILSGLCANYHHNLIPSDYWATASVELADYLLKVLSDQSRGPSCSDHYQRDGQAQ